MAYTAAPETQTYGTHRIPAVVTIKARPGQTTTAYDAGMKNILPFKQGDALIGESRYCIYNPQGINQFIVSNASAVVRGVYVWEKTVGTNYYFVVADDGTNSKVYTATAQGGPWTAVTTLTTHATTPVRFTEFIDSTNVKKLVLVDGIEGYVFTDNTAGTLITDADFPTPHIPFPVFLDGYLFLAKKDTGDIYNSDLNDPAVWTAGSFISSEMYPDDLQAIVKVDNYILAVGTQGCEYFYDAANATASPLARQEGAALPFGTAFPNSIATNKNTVVFLANNNDGETILKVIEGQKYKDIPSQFIARIFNSYYASLVPTATASQTRGYFLRQNGELFYAICPNGTGGGSYPTFVYSFSTDIWTEFGLGNNAGLTYPVAFTAPATTLSLYSYVVGKYGNGIYFGILVPIIPTVASAADFTLEALYVEMRTDFLNFDTLNLKQMHRFAVPFESGNVSYTSSLNGTITVSWSDNNGVSFTSRTLIGSATNDLYQFPFVTQLGAFRRRMMKISHYGFSVSSPPTRWSFFETDINKGQQ